MNRRRLLTGAGGACVLLASPAVRADRPEVRRLALRHAATGAAFNGRWHDGTAPDPVAMVELTGALADSAQILPMPFDPGAISILWEVAQVARLPSPLVVRSGYRTPAINAAVHGAGDSQHLRAAAIDVEVPGARVLDVAETALRLGRGGVGSYPSRGFVHLDSGPVRRWNEDGTVVAGGPGMPLRGASGRLDTRLDTRLDMRLDTRLDLLSQVAREWGRTRLR